ncbi:DoxX family protein [Algoriphagus sp. D3-2-R+10]|uniref:DoxX family protein n=1 Tax=Algoriphagus aurantiacus TaxID=3103948 RepID=UPI002B3E9A7C|nr:DoxX family protein [Algoriphagus sp. D3-2-R+10]MEB2777933.1 DoxX family protein [Algoriphagus sp. D3-2-R+10]
MISNKSQSKSKVTILSWVLRLLASGILLQTLYFKFGAHPDSVALFSQLGVEPIGRIGLGIAELITAILIVVPKTTAVGAITGVFLMLGAIFSHVFIIGIEFRGDGGALFSLAITCFLACLILCVILKNQILTFIKNAYAS